MPRSTHALTKTTALLLTLAAGLALTGCESSPDRTTDRTIPEPGVGFGALVEALTGTFDSSGQAEQDPENFADIRLVMTPIWTMRSDAAWFYVEQAAAAALERPYRQRVYRVSPVIDPQEDLFRSEVYLLPNRERYIAAWNDRSVFDAISPDDLELRDGCGVVLKQVGPWRWAGSTIDDDCPSDFGGADYATSEINLTAVILESWDRGYTSDGEQVWGSTAGPYRFVKQSKLPPGVREFD
jgi:hypothetical protein